MGETLSPVKRKVMRAREAAEYLGLSVSAFRALAAKELESIKITEGRKVWLIEDLDAFLSRRSGRPISLKPTNSWDVLLAKREAEVSKNL